MNRKVSAWRQLLLLGVHDVRLTVKDRSALIWMLVLPVALMWFLGRGASGTEGSIRITIDDRDGGWLARALVDELRDEGIALMELDDGAGEVSGLRTLVLPEGLTESVLRGESRRVRLEVDREVDHELGMKAEAHIRRALVRTLGLLLRMELSPGDDPGDAENRFRQLASEEPLVRLAVSAAGRGEPVPSGFSQSVPGMLTMTVLMMTLVWGGVFLVVEKCQGTLRRQLTLPLSRPWIVGGKLLGRWLIAALQIVLLLVLAVTLFDLSLGRSPAGLILVITCYAVAVAGLAVLLGAISRTAEQASALGWILGVVLAGFGGCWWPRELMPEWTRAFSYCVPTTWAMDGFHALISYGRGVEEVWVPALVLLGFGGLFVLMAARRLGEL